MKDCSSNSMLKNVNRRYAPAVHAGSQPFQKCGTTSAGCELAKGHEGKHVLPKRIANNR